MPIDTETGVGTYRGMRVGPGANLRGKNLKSAVLTGANLEGADLTGAILSKANLTGVKLMEARLAGADLRGANLEEANLSGADLTGAILEGAFVSNADFSGTNLTSADLRVRFSMEISFKGADLTDTNCRDAELMDADFSEAILKNTNFKGAGLMDAVFTGAVLKNTNFSDAQLFCCNGIPTAKLLKPKFTGALLCSANLEGVDLSFLNLSRVDLRDANLRYATLAGSNLTDAKLGGADLRDADLSYSDLSHAEILGAEIDNSTCLINAIMPDPVMYRQSYGEMTGPVLKLDKPGSPVRAADFKKAYPVEFERLKKDTLGRDFTETLKESIKKKYGTPFLWAVSRKKFAYPDQRISKKVNEVICLNMDCRGKGLSYYIMSALERMTDVMRSQEKHPIEYFPFFTLGWVRYTRDDAAKVLLIEEIQSDLMMVRTDIEDTQDFSNAGIDPEFWDELRRVIRPYAERFYEDAVGITFQDAEALGYTVEILSYADKKRIITKGKAPVSVYLNLPRQMGMREKRYTEVPTRRKLVERVSYYKPNPQSESEAGYGTRRGPRGYKY